MLSAPSKNRRRRRKRRKQSITATSTAVVASSSNHDADESPSSEMQPTHHTRQPKVTNEFLNEEAAIETAMLVKHFNKDTELARQRELAIEFFTGNIGWRESEALTAEEDADTEIHANKDEEADVMPLPSSVRTTAYPEEGPQLASSYLNEGVDNVIEPFGRQTIVFDVNQLFVPPLTMPTQWVNAADEDVESGVVQVKHRNLVDEGHFVLAIPSVSAKNRAQNIHRLLAGNLHQWLDDDKHDLAGLFNFSENSKLFKSECGREFHAIYYEPTTELTTANSYALSNKILKLQINDIAFDRHPLFSDEQKIARELEKLYEEYRARKTSDLTGTIQTKLDVIRQHIKSASLPKSSRSSTRSRTIADDLERYRMYRDELRDLRNRVHREMKIDRDIVAAILAKWTELKKERENHASTTSVRLIIRAEESDVERDAVEWSARFNLEFNEIFAEAMDFYREERQRQKQRKREAAEDDIEAATEFESIAKIHRPDAASIRQQLYDIFANSMRPPGEQIIDFDLDYGEKREASATTRDRPKYVVRLLFDEKELDCAVSSNLNKAGVVHVNSGFCVKFITKIPEKLEIQIYEKHQLKVEKKITEIFLPIPYEDETFVNSSPVSICFASATETHSGTISCQIGWKETSSVNAAASSALSARIGPSAGTKMRSTIEKWYTEQLIDPMDPENGTMAPIIDELTSSTPRVQRQAAAPSVDVSHIEHDAKVDSGAGDLFRLNEDMHTFCALNKFNANKRLELLIARFNSDLKLKDCRLVPHTEIEIEVPTDLNNIFEDMLWIDPIDVQRYQGKKYLKHVYDIITNHCTVINRNFEHHDLLVGDTPPTLNGALEALANIFSPRRPLNPTRRTSHSIVRRPNLSDSDRINRFNIVVNVVRATNIPSRSRSERGNNGGPRRSSLASTVQNFHRHANVRPFVTATFKQKTLRTSTVDGSNPTWNEQIVIPINEDIAQIKDSLWFHMYDEIIEDIPSNDELMIPATEIYQKISSHYLGELIIPFSTIFASQRIEGTFEMTTPVILFGYTKPSVTLKEHVIDANAGAIEVRRSILISLLISIEPIIDIVQFSTTHLECIELTRMKNHITSWLNDVREEFPLRAKDPLVCLASGKRVCITRLVGPIDIPFERNDVAEYLIRRFVSLIPVRPHKNVCTKLNGVWLTNDQMLNILIASPKDLGVLLTCYYLSLGFTAYLVMGFAIPYGDTTFVLTKENGEYYLIDPHTGKKCSSRDTFCALTKVYCIVGADNVWANIQREHRVFMQTFDTTQSTEWRALFSKSMPAPNDTVHDLTLEYTDSLDVTGLRKTIETKLMRKIGTWRTSTRKTVWNKRYREELAQILQELEEDRCFEYEQKSYTDKLGTEMLAKYKVSGYPLNMPYVSIARIIERVKATGIHFNSDQKVEFALTVHIQSYPMNIFSVWIFLLALTPL